MLCKTVVAVLINGVLIWSLEATQVLLFIISLFQCWKERSWVCQLKSERARRTERHGTQRTSKMPETECERRHPVLFTSGALEQLWIQDSEPRLHQVFGFLFYASCLTLFYYSVSKKKFSTWNVYYDLTDGIINELNVASVLTGRDWFLWWILILFVRVFSIWLNVHVFKKIMGVFVAPWVKIE